MMDARDAMITRLRGDEAGKKAMAERNTICGSHDDYLWAAAATSRTATDAGRVRAAVGVSTYYVCDSREDEADAIVKSALAPIFNRHVKQGKIAPWSWLQHRLGGKHRRTLVMDVV